MGKIFGFGIIGCGVISKWHADSIEKIDEAKIIGAFDTRFESAQKFAEERNCKAYETLEEMLACEDIDIVCICTPSGLHSKLAIQAANAGKHFIVEKPMAITKKQVIDMIDAVEKNKVKGAVISQLRFTPSIQRAREAIRNGELGRIILGDVYMKYYRSPEYYASAGWRGTWEMDGGGALMNHGIHGIDVLQYLVGPVVSVSGVCKTLTRDIEVEDTANLIVEYASGAIGTIQGTTSVEPGYPRVIEISGTRGTIVIKEDVIVRWDVDGKELSEDQIPKGNANSFRNPAGFDIENHRRQIKDLIDAIKENREPMVNVYEGKKPVDIILAAYESSKTGKKILLY